MRSLNLLGLAACLAVPAVGAPVSAPHTSLIDGEFLAHLRGENDAAIVKAVRAEADAALRDPSHSVMEKRSTPPSGDKHDYMSLAPYWWPNPATPSHLPYIRKDGQHNPEAATIDDHNDLGRMAKDVHALALGYFFTGDATYAKRASVLLHVWFLDPATRMNPNLKYAQAILGVNEGRGTGIIDARDFPVALDGVALLAGSADWTAADDAALHDWFDTYLTWLTTSDNGKNEAATKNNHGNWFDAQAAAIAMYLGKTDYVRQLGEAAKSKHIDVQIEPDGEEPLEEARTMSFHYSAFSLEALMRLATVAQGVGVNLWSYKSARGGSMRAALDYLIPFAEGKKQWQHDNINGFPASDLRDPLLMAAIAYRDGSYEAAAKSIPGKEDVRDLLLERQFAELRR